LVAQITNGEHFVPPTCLGWLPFNGSIQLSNYIAVLPPVLPVLLPKPASK
jgi:hypothetical protein